MGKSFYILSYEVTLKEEYETFNDIFNIFHKMSWERYEDFVEKIYDMSNLDTLMEKLYEISIQELSICVDRAIKMLIGLDIWNVSKEDFWNEYYNQKYFSIEQAYKTCVNHYSAIVEDIQSKKEYRELQRASRSKWSGGGFGLSGAIKGAINAGILNAITGAARFVGDSVVDIMDNYSANSQKQNLQNSGLFEEYALELRKACESVGFALYNKFIQLGIANQVSFNAREAISIFSNVKKNYSLSKKEQIKKLVYCINEYPYNFEVYKRLFELMGHANLQVMELAENFGFEYEVLNHYINNFLKDIDIFISRPDTTPRDSQKKYLSLIYVLKKYGIMNDDESWNNEIIDKMFTDDFINEIKNVLKDIKEKSCTVNNIVYKSPEIAQKEYEKKQREPEIQRVEEYSRDNGQSAGDWIKIILGLLVTIVFIVFVVKVFIGITQTVKNDMNGVGDQSVSTDVSKKDSANSEISDLKPLNPDEPEYFDNSYIINYHRWFGGDIIKKSEGKYVDSEKTYVRYIYSYDNDEYPNYYTALLRKNGFTQTEKILPTDDENVMKEKYVDSPYVVYVYTIYDEKIYGEKAILIVVPNK